MFRAVPRCSTVFHCSNVPNAESGFQTLFKKKSKPIFMTTKDISVYVVLVLLAVAGAWLGGFWGGWLCGFSIWSLITVAIGKTLANKAMTRIDKSVKDIIVENQNARADD